MTDEVKLCKHINRKGVQCKHPARIGKDYCRYHKYYEDLLPQNTNVKQNDTVSTETVFSTNTYNIDDPHLKKYIIDCIKEYDESVAQQQPPAPPPIPKDDGYSKYLIPIIPLLMKYLIPFIKNKLQYITDEKKQSDEPTTTPTPTTDSPPTTEADIPRIQAGNVEEFVPEDSNNNESKG